MRSRRRSTCAPDPVEARHGRDAGRNGRARRRRSSSLTVSRLPLAPQASSIGAVVADLEASSSVAWWSDARMRSKASSGCTTHPHHRLPGTVPAVRRRGHALRQSEERVPDSHLVGTAWAQEAKKSFRYPTGCRQLWGRQGVGAQHQGGEHTRNAVSRRCRRRPRHLGGDRSPRIDRNARSTTPQAAHAQAPRLLRAGWNRAASW